jgi:hypothetical protein
MQRASILKLSFVERLPRISTSRPQQEVAMTSQLSFGWIVREHRRALDLTQVEQTKYVLSKGNQEVEK